MARIGSRVERQGDLDLAAAIQVRKQIVFKLQRSASAERMPRDFTDMITRLGVNSVVAEQKLNWCISQAYCLLAGLSCSSLTPTELYFPFLL